ncbi:unnamed protein product [Ranitomeya imitator]|uniref:Uncharacterized protein n=1 Tax=Ranitomeya imitator TaxID=111125 RepID=A0ABN9LAA4_9NEOB|nr:unnamed protein product [Ranitomeya imitator]
MHDVGEQMEPQLPSCFRWSCRDVGAGSGGKDSRSLFHRQRRHRQETDPRHRFHTAPDGSQRCRAREGHRPAGEGSVGGDGSILEPQHLFAPQRDNMGLFLEQKSQTGAKHELLSYSQFIREQGL